MVGPIDDRIGDLQLLEELQLFGNRLSGKIPPAIGRLDNLKLLSLGEYTGGNDFEAGPMPSFLRTLTNLAALFLSNCNLTGAIPDWLCSLRNLRQLDLQNNSLKGAFPQNIGSLRSLLYLNLKDNRGINGRLPTSELCMLQKLNRLSIVNTNVSVSDGQVQELARVLPRCKIWL